MLRWGSVYYISESESMWHFQFEFLISSVSWITPSHHIELWFNIRLVNISSSYIYRHLDITQGHNARIQR